MFIVLLAVVGLLVFVLSLKMSFVLGILLGVVFTIYMEIGWKLLFRREID